MIQIARKYLAAGFSVIPLLKNKRPPIEWTKYQTEYATEEDLLAWFPKYPSIGIVTGKVSGVSVVDVDVKSGGLETLKTIQLPITWTVKTGGGGWHYYYAYHEDAPQGANLYQGIDGRNDGGYVVAPPSLHESGKRYEWTYKEDELVNFPVHLFKKQNRTDWKAVVAGTQEGGRNNNAAKICGKLMGAFRPKEWESCVLPQLLAWNTLNKPPLEDDEIKAVFDSIAKKAINNVQPTVADVVDGARSVTEIAAALKIKETQEKTFFTWGTSDLDYDMPIMELGSYCVLFGQAGSGKTTFALSLARENKRVCFLSLEMTKEKIVRNYCFRRANVSKEMYKRGKYDRSIFDQYSKELKDLLILGVDEESTKKDFTASDIEKVAQRDDVDLIVIDNFNKLANAEHSEIAGDNDTSSKLLFITRQHDVALIVIHHTNKPTGKKPKILRGLSGMRGTNKLVDDADVVCELGRDLDEDVTHIAVYKDRDWDARASVELTYNGHSFERKQFFNNPALEELKF